jgi:hypothetical protein
MNIHFNSQIKNEENLLDILLPYWKLYPVNKFVFYDYNSIDNGINIISKHLPKERFHIINDKIDTFNESHSRSRMFEYSRENKADIVFSIDADELLSANFERNFDEILKIYNECNLLLYWYNVVNNSTKKIRQDPAYINNFKNFIIPVKFAGKFDMNQWKYHSVARAPNINLPTEFTKDIGIIHLQAINRRFYALKQLWYKHFELVNYNHSIDEINNRYDSVVNNLQFNAIDTPPEIIGNIEFDPLIYDKIEKKKGYLSFIKEHLNEKLITFGKEYIYD